MIIILRTAVIFNLFFDCLAGGGGRCVHTMTNHSADLL